MNKFILPILFAVIGFLFSTRYWIRTMDTFSPFVGLLVYYTIITGVILILEYFGLVISGIEYKSWQHTLGTVLIIFSFFIIVDWESCYTNIVTKGTCNEKELSNVFLQSEDGAVYYLWSKLTSNIEYLRLLTYVFTPFILSIIGQYLITEKVTLSLL